MYRDSEVIHNLVSVLRYHYSNICPVPPRITVAPVLSDLHITQTSVRRPGITVTSDLDDYTLQRRMAEMSRYYGGTCSEPFAVLIRAVDVLTVPSYLS